MTEIFVVVDCRILKGIRVGVESYSLFKKRMFIEFEDNNLQYLYLCLDGVDHLHAQ